MAKKALVGFTLSSVMVPKQARGSGSGLYYLLANSLVSTTTMTVGMSVAAAVQGVSEGFAKWTKEGDPTQSIIEAAVLERQSDLSMHLRLLGESPTVFSQLEMDVRTGQGRVIGALAHASGVPVEELAALWSEARVGQGAVEDSQESLKAVELFSRKLYSRVVLDDAILADVLWALVIEQTQEVAPATSAWIGGVLGVDVDSLLVSLGDAVTSVNADGLEAGRRQVYAEPRAFLTRLAVVIESQHSDAIQNQLDAMFGANAFSLASLKNQKG